MFWPGTGFSVPCVPVPSLVVDWRRVMPRHRCHICKGPLLPLCELARTTVPALPILIPGLVLPYFDTYTFISGAPVATTIGYGTVVGHQGYRKQLGNMTASSAGHLSLDMSKLALDFNFR